METYIRPVKGKYRITSDYRDHLNRKTPSTEPGTDYGYDYGSEVIAPASATVVDIKTNNGGAMGRYVMLSFGGGQWGRAIHLAQTRVHVGQRISQGSVIGLSGGSAHGSDWGVDPHVHWTFWDGFTRQPVPGSDLPDPWENFLGTAVKGTSAQRTALAQVNRRSKPSTLTPVMANPLKQGDVGNFTGFIRGQSVEGNNVWFQGISGHWFWSGGFVGGANTAGLKDLGWF